MSVNSDMVKIMDTFLFSLGNDLDLAAFLSRIPNIMISLLLGVFIFLYSKRLNGAWAAIISLAMFVFSPSFLAHSPLVTMDVPVSCFYFATIYFLMRFFETMQDRYLILTGLSLGLSLIAKFSALVLVPTLYILLAIYAFNSYPRESRLKSYLFLLPLLPLACSYKASFKFMAAPLFSFLFLKIFVKNGIVPSRIRYACAVLLIILTIAFTLVILDYTDFKWFPFHGATKAYFKGFSSFEGHSTGGQGRSYLLGHYYYDTGKWYYFPLAMVFKEPTVFFFLLTFGLTGMFIKRGHAMEKLLLLVPALAYLFMAMFVNKVNIGIRHILPLYPFLYVIVGYGVVVARKFKRTGYLLGTFIMLLIADTVLAYPSHISYFNRLVECSGGGHRFLGDSNIAWGQDWKRLKKYIDKNGLNTVKIQATFTCATNCKYYNIPYEILSDQEKVCPERGYYIIEKTALVSREIKWADKIRPSARIGGSLLMYKITEKGAARYKEQLIQ